MHFFVIITSNYKLRGKYIYLLTNYCANCEMYKKSSRCSKTRETLEKDNVNLNNTDAKILKKSWKKRCREMCVLLASICKKTIEEKHLKLTHCK